MEDELEARLRNMGHVPVAPDVEAAHLGAIRAASPAPRWRFGWKAVAAAGIAGFLAGSTGLAAAGNLPDPAQDVAHDVLGAIGVDVPRSTEGCPEGTTYRNHGEYVSAVEAAGGDVEAAAHSDCGMPVRGNHGGHGNGNQCTPGTPRPDTDGDPCTGPPPWAGAHLSAEERAAAQAEREATCGPDEDTEADEPEAEEQDEAPAAPDETTTTLAPDTTESTVDVTTTSTTSGS